MSIAQLAVRYATPVAPLLLGLALAGCKNDYSFPPLEATVVKPPADHGQWLSMDVAPDGVRPTISYYDRDLGAVGYAVGYPQGDGSLLWRHEHVDGYPDAQGLDIGDIGSYTSQKTAPDGTVWLAYHDNTNGGLWVAHRNGPDDWTKEKVDAGSGLNPRAGMWASLALDANGSPVVAHYDKGARTLRVSHLSDGTWATDTAFTGTEYAGTDPVSGEDFVRQADAGSYANLFIGDDGTEHIAFYDTAFQSLRMVSGSVGSYVPALIDNAGNVGQWPSVFQDTNGALMVAYHDVTNQDLKLATKQGPNWVPEVIDSGEYVGADSDVLFIDGDLAIIYFDGRENDMRLARRTGTTWALSTIGGQDGAVGYHNEAVVTSSGIWAGSYNYSARGLFTVNLAQ